MKSIIFLAGPYRSDVGGNDGIYENLYIMRKVAKALMKKDYPVVCPNLTMAFMDGFLEEIEKILAITTGLVKVCDVVLFTPGWKKSVGCQVEFEKARELGIPVLEMKCDSNMNFEDSIEFSINELKNLDLTKVNKNDKIVIL